MPIEVSPLPPEEAVRYFRGKGYRVGFDWRDVWEEEHARAFTVAKVMRYDILEDIRREVDDALANGKTLDQFRKDLTPTLQEKGWWGRADMVDPASGQLRNVQLGSPRRLQIIYDTNLRSARSAGRWDRIMRNKARRPYLRYSAVMDNRTRPQHRAWHGIILPVEHPFWERYYPPNGWNCRCIVQQWSERDLKRRGWKVTTEERFQQIMAQTRQYRNRRTGEIQTVQRGIDPGFNFNVGKAHLRGLTPPPQSGPISTPHIRPDPIPPLPGPRRRRAGDLLPSGREESYYVDQFLNSFGASRGNPVVYTDKLGEPVVIDESFFSRPDGSTKLGSRTRKSSLKLLAEAIEDPDEIWWSWEKIKIDQQGTRTEFRLRRRYFTRFNVDGKPVPLVLAMDVGKDGWRGVTAFPADREKYLNTVRGGVLAYRRK